MKPHKAYIYVATYLLLQQLNIIIMHYSKLFTGVLTMMHTCIHIYIINKFTHTQASRVMLLDHEEHHHYFVSAYYKVYLLTTTLAFLTPSLRSYIGPLICSKSHFTSLKTIVYHLFCSQMLYRQHPSLSLFKSVKNDCNNFCNTIVSFMTCSISTIIYELG